MIILWNLQVLCALHIAINRAGMAENRESAVLILESFDGEIGTSTAIASAPDDVAVIIGANEPDVISSVWSVSHMIPSTFGISVI